VLRLRQPVWVSADAVSEAERWLAAEREFTAVSGPFDPNATPLTPTAYASLFARYGPPRGSADPARLAPAGTPEYRAYLASGSFVSADGRTVSFATLLAAGNATTTGAAQAVPSVRVAAARAASLAGASAWGVAGQPAATYDIARLSDDDLRTVIPIAIAVIAVLLALDGRGRGRGAGTRRADGHLPGQDAAGAVGRGTAGPVELVAVPARRDGLYFRRVAI
jgi:hypothetical protein